MLALLPERPEKERKKGYFGAQVEGWCLARRAEFTDPVDGWQILVDPQQPKEVTARRRRPVRASPPRRRRETSSRAASRRRHAIDATRFEFEAIRDTKCSAQVNLGKDVPAVLALLPERPEKERKKGYFGAQVEGWCLARRAEFTDPVDGWQILVDPQQRARGVLHAIFMNRQFEMLRAGPKKSRSGKRY